MFTLTSEGVPQAWPPHLRDDLRARLPTLRSSPREHSHPQEGQWKDGDRAARSRAVSGERFQNFSSWNTVIPRQTMEDNFRKLYTRLWLALLKPDQDEIKVGLWIVSF